MSVISVLNLVGTVTLVVTLVFVARQTSSLKRDVQLAADANAASGYQHVRGIAVEVDRLFLDRPAIKPYFYEGKAPPRSGSLRRQIDSMAEILVDLADAALTLGPLLARTSGSRSVYDWGFFGRYLHFLHEQSPVLREFLAANESWYPAETMTVFRTGVLPSAEVTGPARRAWRRPSGHARERPPDLR